MSTSATGIAPTQQLTSLDLADAERFAAAHDAARCVRCGDRLPAGYPETVACGGCLAAQLPARVAAELHPPCWNCGGSGVRCCEFGADRRVA